MVIISHKTGGRGQPRGVGVTVTHLTALETEAQKAGPCLPLPVGDGDSIPMASALPWQQHRLPQGASGLLTCGIYIRLNSPHANSRAGTPSLFLTHVCNKFFFSLKKKGKIEFSYTTPSSCK